MEPSDRKRRLDQLKSSNQQIRRLANEGHMDQVSLIASQMKRNLEYESISDTNSIRVNNQTSAFNIVEHNQYEEESKRRNILDRSPPPIDDLKPAKQRKRSIHAFTLEAKTTEQEIMELKQLRLNNELEIKQLHRQVEQLKGEVEELRSSPIFRCTERLELFCTKIFVRQEDYHKVDYVRFQCQLEATCINIYRDEAVWRSLKLERIKEVKYLDRKMMLEFQGDSEESDYLFLSFDDAEHLKKWDFGMYVNRFILFCTRKERLFWSEYSTSPNVSMNSSPIRALGREREPSASNNVSPPNRKPSYNEMPKKVDTYRQPIIEQPSPPLQVTIKEPNMNTSHRNRLMSNQQSEGSVHYSKGRKTPEPQTSRKTPPIDLKMTSSIRKDEIKQTTSFMNSSFNNYSQQGSPAYNVVVEPEPERYDLERNYQKQKERIDDVTKQIQEKKKRIRERKDEERIEFKPPSEEEDEKQIDKTNQLLSTTPHANSARPIEHPPATSRTQPSPFATNKLNLFPKELPVINLQPADLNNSTISVEESELSKKQIIDSLRKHKQFMKYAKGGLKPRMKQIYLSENEEQLCWKDIQTKKINKIKVSGIQQIIVGQLGEGMKRHDSKLNRDECIIIKNSDRVLELHSPDKEQVKKFAHELEFFRNLERSVVE